jgi:hypothetical protein
MQRWPFLLFLLALQQTGSIDIISDYVLPLNIRDPRDPTKTITVRQKTATFTCTQFDNDQTHRFEIITPRPAADPRNPPSPTKQYYEVSCLKPVYSYIVRKIGSSPLYAIDTTFKVNMSPYNQGNLTAQLKEDVVFHYGPIENGGEQAGYGRRLLAMKPVVQVGTGGIGIGVDLTCMIPGLKDLGGCGNADLDDIMNAIDKQAKALSSFADETRGWMKVSEGRFKNIENFNEIVSSSISRQWESIGTLQKEIDLVWKFEIELAETVTEGFTQFKGELARQAKGQEEIIKLMLGLHNATNQQFLETNRALQGQSRMVQDLITTVYQIYQDIGMRRAVTQLFWDMSEHPLVVPQSQVEYQPLCLRFKGTQYAQRFCDNNIGDTFRFVGPLMGKAPLDPLDIVSSIDTAIIMADTVVQYTQITPEGVSYAMSDRWYLKCDRLFMINNGVPGMSLKVLFARMGPTDCNDNPKNWKCACAVQVLSQECTKRSDGDHSTRNYPFGYTMKKTLEENEGAVCTSAVRTAKLDALVSHPDVVAEMTRRYCNSKTKYGDQKGWSFLIGSTELERSWNVSSPKPGAQRLASCTTSFYGVNGGTTDSISSNIYYSWQQTYQILAKTLLIEAENDVYGMLPTGIQTVDVPYDRDPVTSGVSRSVHTRFTSVAQKMEDLYFLSLDKVEAGMEGITLNEAGQPIQDKPNVFEPGVQDFLWLNVKNRTLTTNVQMTVAGSESMAPFLYRYGPYDPARVPYIYDVPMSLISSAETVNARCNHINYLFKSVNWTGDFSRDQWDLHNMVRYQPDCATESMLYYRRYFAIGGSVCEYSFWTGDKEPNFPLYEWCHIFNNFVCESYTRDGIDFLRCSPKVYVTQATLSIPAGSISTTVSSECPNIRVTQMGGHASVTLTSSADYPNKVNIELRPKPGTTLPPKDICKAVYQGITLYPRIDTPIDFTGCPALKLEMNVFTLLNLQAPCFTPWVDVSASADYSGKYIGPGVITPLIDIYTRKQNDAVADALARQMARQVDFQIELQRIAESSKNYPEIYERVQRIVRNNTIEINKIIVKNVTDRARELDKIIREETKKIADDVAKGKQEAERLAKLIKELADLNKQGEAQFRRVNVSVEALIEANKAVQKAISDWKKAQEDAASCSTIPFLSQIYCFFKNILSPGDWLQKIVGLIFLCLILMCIGFCLFKCIQSCRACSQPEYREQQRQSLSYPGEHIPTESEMRIIQAWLEKNKGRQVQDDVILQRLQAIEDAAKRSAGTVASGTAEEKASLLKSTLTKSKTRAAGVIMKHASRL